MRQLARDVRLAFRTLSRSPGYTGLGLLTLVIGIGASTSVFSVVNGILLAPLPFPEPDRLVRVWEVSSNGHHMQAAWRNFVDWREGARSFETLAAHTAGGQSTVLGTGRPLRVGVSSVSEGFFRAMGISPAVGRSFAPEEHGVGADPVVVVSDGFWRTYLGGDPDLSRARLEVAGFSVRVVGVMPPGFEYPGDIDIWVPVELDEPSTHRTAHNYMVVGRLRPGTTVPQADQDLDAITARFLEEDPGAAQETWFQDYFPVETSVETLHEATVGTTSRTLWILLGAAALVLLVACTNLASATLARGTARTREYAVRQALGVGRAGLVRQIFAEGLVLSLGGAALGAACAWGLSRALPLLAPAGVPRVDEVRLDGAVLGFAVALAVFTAILFGLLPALRLTDRSLANPLRSGARTEGGPGGHRVWKALVAVEMALALVLLVGSGLLVRSFWRVISVDPGFRTEGLLTATVNPPSSRYGEPVQKGLYYERLLAELATLPGIADIGLVSSPPLTWSSNGLVGVRGGPREGVSGDYHLASPGYFAAMGIPLLRGRLFDGTERPEGAHVVIVNETFAAEAWPEEDPIGKQMTGGGMDDYWEQDRWATVIGVVADIRQRSLTRPADPAYYFPLSQRPFRSWSMTAVIRPETGRASALAPSVREAVARVDTDVPVTFRTVEERVSGALAARRFTLMVLGVFAACALALAALGVYGVVAYAVERRTREIGIRIALGAQPGAVRRLVQREYFGAALLGAGAGVLLALALTRVMESLLYGVEATDGGTFAGVVALLAVAAWLASFIPSLRSTRVDPMIAMRAD